MSALEREHEQVLQKWWFFVIFEDRGSQCLEMVKEISIWAQFEYEEM